MCGLGVELTVMAATVAAKELAFVAGLRQTSKRNPSWKTMEYRFHPDLSFADGGAFVEAL